MLGRQKKRMADDVCAYEYLALDNYINNVLLQQLTRSLDLWPNQGIIDLF